MKTKDITKENLRWIRIFDPVHIPREYIDQIKQKEFTTDRFYKFQDGVCLIEHELGLCINPYNLLFVLVDDSTKVKGVLWMVIDSLANALVINTFSVDKEYWGNGKAIELLIEKAKEVKEQENLERVYWITRSPKHSEKFGFKRSKNVLMEYSDGKYNKGSERSSIEGIGKRELILGRRGETSGRSSIDDEGTKEILEKGT